MIKAPDYIASVNIRPHVMGSKGPMVHLTHFIQILNSYYLPEKLLSVFVIIQIDEMKRNDHYLPM